MKITETHFPQLVIGIVLLLVSAGAVYRLYDLSKALADREAELASSTAGLLALKQKVAVTESSKAELESNLAAERERNNEFAEKMEDISDTVGVLEKIKNTDPQLLEKYSKVYFLNENYVPSRLAQLDSKYLYNPKQDQYFHAGALEHLEEMLDDAAADEIPLRVTSAYRSFETQAAVKASHLTVYGSGANKFSADQGYSEHQLGTTVDLILPSLTALTTDFETTEAYQWLTKNAYKYGFILSYPKGNTYYQFEPWHWRFVGLRLAKYLHKEGKNFYDLDQRDIDKYRANFFD